VRLVLVLEYGRYRMALEARMLRVCRACSGTVRVRVQYSVGEWRTGEWGVIYRFSLSFPFLTLAPSFGVWRVGLVCRYRGRTDNQKSNSYLMIPAVSYYGMLCVQSALLKGWEMMARHAVGGCARVNVLEWLWEFRKGGGDEMRC